MEKIKGLVELMNSLTDNTNVETTVGFVPTMGALHVGHSSLVRRAAAECDIVVASILVNPTQFDKPSDFELYPEAHAGDAALLEAAGCDVLFTPTAEELYGGEPFAPSVNYGELTRVLEAAHRRGHFDGVIAVVDRLFDAVKPSRAYFGEKDLQQLAVVRELAKRQHQALEVVGCALVRDSNGIALSSRNARLSEQGMRTARELSIALRAIAEAGGRWPLVLQEERSRLSADRRIDLEYLEMIVGDTFTNADPSIASEEQGLWAVIAAQVEGVRLIDNMELVSSQAELKKPTQN